jgi:hypothetical protein
MRAVDFLLETLSHFARGVEGPPPGVPFHADAEFETDLVALGQHQSLSTIISESFDELALPPTISRITIARIKQHGETLLEQRRRRLGLAGRIATAFAAQRIRAAFLGDVWTGSQQGLVGQLRPIGRIDLMVDERQWVETVGTLRSMGLVRSRIQPRLAAGRERDLKSALDGPGRDPDGGRGSTSAKAAADALRYHQYFAPLVMHDSHGDSVAVRFRVIDFGHPSRTNAAWERVASAVVAGEEAPVVGLEDQLIHSLVSFGVEGFVDLLQLLDAGWMLSQRADSLDWDYLTGRLRARGLYSTFYFTLELVCDLLRIRLETELASRPPRWRRKLFHMWWRPKDADYSGETEPTAGRFAYGLIECGGPVAKALWLRRALFPRSSWVRSVYGRPANLWLRLKFLHDVRSGRRRRSADTAETQGETGNFRRLR